MPTWSMIPSRYCSCLRRVKERIISATTLTRFPEKSRVLKRGLLFLVYGERSSGGGDPPCISSGEASFCEISVRTAPSSDPGLAARARLEVGRGFAAGRRLALVRRFPTMRRFETVCGFAVVRRFAMARRFTVVRFFRDEREVPSRFFRFAISYLRTDRSILPNTWTGGMEIYSPLKAQGKRMNIMRRGRRYCRSANSGLQHAPAY